MQILQNFWNSPDQLSSAFRILTVFSILMTATFGSALYFLKERIGTLQGEKSAAQTRVVEQQVQSLDEQRKRIRLQEADVKRLKDELVTVNAKAAELAAKALDAERNVTDTYDFNGGHRQTSGGRVNLSVGTEFTVFQQLMELEKKKDWPALLSLSERQIQATPNWLTPFLTAGVALANLSRFEEAKKHLESVVARAGNDPQYKVAVTILEQIKLGH
jgi:hypothetical protein